MEKPNSETGEPAAERTLADDSKTLAESVRAAEAPHTSNDLQPSPQIPDHELLQRIGKGSYGEVWLARNVMGFYRAVKIVYRATFEHARPFDREFNGIKKFEPISRSHDGLVDILQVGRTDEYFYYVMELADDVSTGQEIDPAHYTPRTLRSAASERGRMGFEDCVQIGLSLTQALGHMHKHGLIHRDIKPANIIFVHKQAKLADIGLVAEQSEAKSFVGTEGFIPPEGPGAPQADIYSLGKVLYEIATGKDRHEFPALPTLLGDTTSDTHLLELNSVFLKACQNDIKQRYQTCEQMREDLVLLQGGKSVARVHLVERRLALLMKISAVGVTLTALIGAGFIYARHQAQVQTELRERAEQQRKLAEAKEFAARQNLYAADMLLAQQALEGNNLGRASQLLERHRPEPSQKDLRGWEWRHLSRLCRSDEIATLGKHDRPVFSLSFSPDGRRVATASQDRTVRIWDAVKRVEVAKLEQEDQVFAVSFSPQGDLLVCSVGRRLRLWDTSTLREIGGFDIGLPNYVFAIAFARDGNTVALGDEGGRIQLLDLHERRATPPWLDPDGFVTKLVFTPDGKSLLSAGLGSGPAKLWDLNTKRVIRTFSHPKVAALSGSVQSAALSPDGRTVGTGGNDKTARLWDLGTGQEIAVLAGHGSRIRAIAFSPDGSKIATGSDDETIRLWDLSTRREIAVLKGHSDEINDLIFSPDGQRLASVSKDQTLRLWSASIRQDFQDRITIPDETVSVPFSSDRRHFAVLNAHGRATLWETATLQEQATLDLGDSLMVRAAAVSVGGDLLAVASPDETLHLWSFGSKGEVAKLASRNGVISALAFSPDGAKVAVSREDKTVEILDSRLNSVRTLRLDVLPYSLAFSPDSRILSIGSGRGLPSGPIRLWDLATGREQASLMGHQALVRRLAFSASGDRLSSVSWDGTARVWDVKSHREIASLRSQIGSPTGMEFSPDGSRVIIGSGSDDSTRLWHIETQQELLSLKGQGFYVLLAAFLDGDSIVTYDGHTVRVWRAAPLEEIEAVAKARVQN